MRVQTALRFSVCNWKVKGRDHIVSTCTPSDKEINSDLFLFPVSPRNSCCISALKGGMRDAVGGYHHPIYKHWHSAQQRSASHCFDSPCFPQIINTHRVPSAILRADFEPGLWCKGWVAVSHRHNTARSFTPPDWEDNSVQLSQKTLEQLFPLHHHTGLCYVSFLLICSRPSVSDWERSMTGALAVLFRMSEMSLSFNLYIFYIYIYIFHFSFLPFSHTYLTVSSFYELFLLLENDDSKYWTI